MATTTPAAPCAAPWKPSATRCRRPTTASKACARPCPGSPTWWWWRSACRSWTATAWRGASAAAALTPAALAGRDEPAKKRKLKKAIMYATIGYEGSVLEKFKAVKAAGFEGVEPMSHMKQDEVIKAFEETGLKPASVCCDT